MKIVPNCGSVINVPIASFYQRDLARLFIQMKKNRHWSCFFNRFFSGLSTLIWKTYARVWLRSAWLHSASCQRRYCLLWSLTRLDELNCVLICALKQCLTANSLFQIFVGAIVDSNCRLWSVGECGERGACMLYDNDQLRWKFFLTLGFLKVITALFDSFVSH